MEAIIYVVALGSIWLAFWGTGKIVESRRVRQVPDMVPFDQQALTWHYQELVEWDNEFERQTGKKPFTRPSVEFHSPTQEAMFAQQEAFQLQLQQMMQGQQQQVKRNQHLLSNIFGGMFH